MERRAFLFVMTSALLPFGGCSRPPATRRTPLNPRTLAELQGYLLGHPPDVDLFRARGPFAVTVKQDHATRLSPKERIDCDLYLSAPDEKAPLVVLQHGYDSSKESHGYQGVHLASWGLHCLIPQLPNTGPWFGNGRTLARIAAGIHRQPEIVDARIDAGRIVLAGHSFGGASVCIALAEGAPVAGGVLLDPAGLGRDLPSYLGRIRKPVILLGADQEVFTARRREVFYRYIRSGIAEVSIRDANHEDAQYPTALSGIELLTTEALQIAFVSALTSAAFSLAATGSLDYVWASFSNGIGNGRFIHAKRKPVG